METASYVITYLHRVVARAAAVIVHRDAQQPVVVSVGCEQQVSSP